MRPSALLLAAALVVPSIARAQAASPATATSPVVDARDHWRMMSSYVLRSASDLPEDKYGYRPTAGVRSFAELFSHVAGAEAMFCAMALGEKVPSEDAVTARSKTDLVAALRQSTQYCERAYAQSDAAAAGTVDVFGAPHTRLYVLMFNATHDAEHYGNLVTYLRMNGIVPPSSQPSR
jgi:uncharacterized damage-inducible protein DinB